MTEADLVLCICREFRDRSLCIPRYTPSKWSECDVFEVTKSGTFREWECKTSVSDLRADLKKTVSRYPSFRTLLKHELLAKADEHGPSFFSYVVPDGLVGPEALPEFAGLYYAMVMPRFGVVSTRLECIRKPRRLHSLKVSEEQRKQAASVCYHRYLSTLDRLTTRNALEVARAND